MQPMGRKSKRFPCKVDHHPRPKYKWINWWEDICSENKKGERQLIKKLLKRFNYAKN